MIFAAIGYILVFPIALILAVMYLPNWLYDKRMERKHGPRYAHNPNNDPCLRFGLCLLGVVLFPVMFIGLVIYGIRQLFKSEEPKVSRYPTRRR